MRVSPWLGVLCAALISVGPGCPVARAAEMSESFPRLMGMNIGEKNYDDRAYQKELARLDIVILGFYRGWRPAGYAPTATLAMRKVVQALKAQNPKILVGQYTMLSEAGDDREDIATLDLRDKLNANHWWLLNAAGKKVQWTRDYLAWDTNFTAWTRPDAVGRRWPQWLAERNYSVFFRDIPEFDIVFLDGVGAPRVTADWNLDGVNDDRNDPRILAAHYAGHVAEWKRLHELAPKLLLVGNTDNDLASPELRGRLDGGFLEGLMGPGWSLEVRNGWNAMMERYRAVLRNTRAPRIVGFNVQGNPADYRFFRYAYASCLLADGYFSFTDAARGYSSVPWFDEYDFKLGTALAGAPLAPWSQDVWRRDFQNGVVLVNPADAPRTVRLGPGLLRIVGKQDPATNNGSAAVAVTLAPKDGIVLRRIAPGSGPMS